MTNGYEIGRYYKCVDAPKDGNFKEGLYYKLVDDYYRGFELAFFLDEYQKSLALYRDRFDMNDSKTENEYLGFQEGMYYKCISVAPDYTYIELDKFYKINKIDTVGTVGTGWAEVEVGNKSYITFPAYRFDVNTASSIDPAIVPEPAIQSVIDSSESINLFDHSADIYRLCQSFLAVAERQGENTNWDQLKEDIEASLSHQHRMMFAVNRYLK